MSVTTAFTNLFVVALLADEASNVASKGAEVSVKVVAPLVNCTSVCDDWSASIILNTTPLAGVIFLKVAVSFTSCAVPVGVSTPLSLNLICILDTSTSSCGEETFATPCLPAFIAVENSSLNIN